MPVTDAKLSWDDPAARQSATRHIRRPADGEPRRCFWIPVQNPGTHGFIPSLVTEDEPGHTPMSGRGTHAAPWYWGMTMRDAQRICAHVNYDTFGINPREALDIAMSSMRAAQQSGR